ncbi:MAG: A/G-specific adenine glycosylase [Brevinemataceae bacterium]
MISIQIQKEALLWFHQNKRNMPWRTKPTPYRVWISEMMLQQTTVATVIGFFERFMDHFPQLSDLAEAEEDEVLTLWAGLGYYSRAKNILKTAKILKKEENFPLELSELQNLPGIGPYTAGAVSSIAFNLPNALVDTNVDRVLGRFLGLERTQIGFNKLVSEYAQKLMDQVEQHWPHDIWAWNQVLMELGALICTVRKADCIVCPLQTECKAFLSGNPLSFPGEKSKALIKNINESSTIIYVGDKIVLSKITSGKRRVGLYDFVMEEVQGAQKIGTLEYRISNNKVLRTVYQIIDNDYLTASNEILVDPNIVSQSYALTSPCKKFLTRIQSQLRFE